MGQAGVRRIWGLQGFMAQGISWCVNTFTTLAEGRRPRSSSRARRKAGGAAWPMLGRIRSGLQVFSVYLSIHLRVVCKLASVLAPFHKSAEALSPERHSYCPGFSASWAHLLARTPSKHKLCKPDRKAQVMRPKLRRAYCPHPIHTGYDNFEGSSL